jgi:hypothetical protein
VSIAHYFSHRIDRNPSPLLQAMSQVLLNQILNQLPSLEPSELQQLSQAVQNHLKDSELLAKRTAFHQALVESGLVRQIKTTNFEGRIHRHFIQVQGEPISQTIIGERR